MRPAVHAFSGSLLILLVAGCGGDGGNSPTAPPEKGPTLNLEFQSIEIIEVCDGFLEGFGDFKFLIDVEYDDNLPRARVYESSVLNLNDGMLAGVGRLWRHTFDASFAEVTVHFTASELDRSITGEVYNDERLDEAKGQRSYTSSGGRWGGLGSQSIRLGASGCWVELQWRAY